MFEFGCKTGEHTGWAIVEAESGEEALMMVPAMFRHMAGATRLDRLTYDDILSLHDWN